MPVNWVDGVTPVNAANLETMEADTAAKQAQSEKAQANGYAPLDSGAKVPLVNLPPVSGVDFIGTWAAGTAYKRGDVIRYNGNDYMAVNDSTGVTPPAPGMPIIVGASYGTTLPTAPFDGQEAILVDSLTAPTYQWRFRFNAGSSLAQKWEFIGGSDALAEQNVSAEATTVVNTYLDLATIGPRIVVPRAGIYEVACSAIGSHTVASSTIYITMGIGAAASPFIQLPLLLPLAGAGGWTSFETLATRVSLAAGDEVRMRYYNGSTGQATYWMRWLRVRPLRVA